MTSHQDIVLKRPHQPVLDEPSSRLTCVQPNKTLKAVLLLNLTSLQIFQQHIVLFLKTASCDTLPPSSVGLRTHILPYHVLSYHWSHLVERAYCKFVMHLVCVTYLCTVLNRLFCGERICWVASYCQLWCHCYSWCCLLYDVDLLHFVTDHGTQLHHLPQGDPLLPVRPLQCCRVLL